MKASALIFAKLKMLILLSTSFLLKCHICVTKFFQVDQICRAVMTLVTKIDKKFVGRTAKKWHFFTGKTMG
jgi:hypothetical protein